MMNVWHVLHRPARIALALMLAFVPTACESTGSANRVPVLEPVPSK